ncbi:MAG: UDP-N-acetylmuramoyl-L-alanyl-D-glutamate--2,6-diaminopimelate ligase [Xylophilus sp.]|nr:UDP-N-acetylmuramoyl-L-alanyl-D-glutamate--2,6-diaminopimelate ligase [Xylophilus sp.]KAF1048959.1 MAG: UDP-N-acetylmuramoyl-L-alanyl-D-glutamate--2,6-diaminopimelate ligase [Xylophilus sp.]
MSPTILRTPEQAVQWLRARAPGTLQTDSRAVGAGDGFIAWPGAATDGRGFVGNAFAQGAGAALVEAEGAEVFDFGTAEVAAYPGLKAATGPIAALWFGRPSHALDVLAVTGTNGKTSTAWWLAQAATQAGIGCAVVGTLGTGVPPDGVVHNGLTTPDPVLLQRAFRTFADGGLRAAAIEASSIGIAEQRLAGTRIRTAIFTNFTQDHLDYHGSMEAYWRAKVALFAHEGLRAAVVNVDDPAGVRLAGELAGGGLDVWTVSLHAGARLVAQVIQYTARGISCQLAENGHSEPIPLYADIGGDYNLSNLLGVVAALRTLGVPLAEAAAACARLAPVPGRMERVARDGQPLAVVDYAHTPDAIEKALAALRPLSRARGGRLICVFGCGGDRDATKRPRMAQAAARGADRVWITSDNPRSEDPRAIIEQIAVGLPALADACTEADRARAIHAALAEAAPADVVLIAGKGHEATQETAGVRRPFSDRAEAEAALAARTAA